MIQIVIIIALCLLSVVLFAGLVAGKKRQERMKKQIDEIDESLGAAIGIADVFFYDYYPDRKEAVALSKLDALSIGKVIYNYPEYWFEKNIIHPDDIERARKMFEKIDAGEKAAEEEYRVMLDGKYHWYLYKMQSVYNASGTRVKVVVSRMDITYRKEAELGYQKHLNALFLNSASTLFFCHTDLTKNKVTEFYSVHEALRDRVLISSGINDILGNLSEYISPIFRERCVEKFSRENLLEEFQKGNLTVQFTFSYMQGENIRWAECTAEMMRKPRSGDVDAIMYVTDVSYNRIIELIIDSTADHDYDYLTFVFGRTQEFVEYTWLVPESFSYQDDYSKRLIESLAEKNLEDQEQVLEKLKWDKVLEHLRYSGEYVIYFTQYQESGKRQRKKLQFFFIDDTEELILVSQRDVTDVYEAELEHQEVLSKALEEAKAANAAKTEFLARMSHDIRTPMNAIIGITALAFDDVGDEDAIRDDLTKINSSSHFLLGLINDILDMSKIEDGSMELRNELCRYEDFIGDLQTMFEPLCKQNELTLQIKKSDKEIPPGMADKIRLKQIFFNIMSNAVKYTPAGGTISYYEEEVRITEKENYIAFVVEDNGIGMSKEFMERMYQPFAQERNEVASGVEGTGLGLSITKSLIELMGGTIRIESELGKGTKITVCLTFERANEAEYTKRKEEKEKHREQADDILEGKRIFLVEDHPINTAIARRLLEKKGVVVYTAENGREAVKKFKGSAEGFFDAILMDIRMPEMTGLEASEAIRALDRDDAKKVPIIAMTANAYEEDVRLSKEAGMNSHLSKPIETDSLYRTLAEEISKI